MQYPAGGYLGLYGPLGAAGGGVRAATLVEALRDRLLTLAAVTDLCGERVYTLRFPQSLEAPAVRLQEIDRISSMHLRGDVAVRRARVQIDTVESDAHGDAYTTAHALADAVRGTLRSGSPSGLVGIRDDLSGVPVLAIAGDDRREHYDADARMVCVEQDFLVWFHV